MQRKRSIRHAFPPQYNEAEGDHRASRQSLHTHPIESRLGPHVFELFQIQNGEK